MKIIKKIALLMLVIILAVSGCNPFSGYSNKSLYRADVSTVYVEMFEDSSFRRGIEYELTDALGKQIETKTPYKIVTDRNRADTIISGYITNVDEGVLTTERQVGRPLEKEITLSAKVNWKDLRTGELLIDNETVTASADYSQWLEQGFDYASSLAANKLAQRIVEQMETEW
ncbi:MAG: LPS assembly lipoprotein LptE [Phycisphaerae bacterium]|nr:LPS assembly lipoprotein LptE [Phycisphaerae bacterium]